MYVNTIQHSDKIYINTAFISYIISSNGIKILNNQKKLTPIPTLYGDATAMLSVTPTIASRFPLFSQIDSSLYRERLNKLPTLPISREALILPTNLQQTIAGSTFLQYSSSNTEILIFGTEDNIRMLSTKVHWCVDSTFRSVPHLYLQLFIIHAFEGDKLIPLIYCLLSAKTRVIYSELFRALKDNAGNLNVVLAPELVTCDFESGQIKALDWNFLMLVSVDVTFIFARQFIARCKFWVYLNYMFMMDLIGCIYESFLHWPLSPLNLSL